MTYETIQPLFLLTKNNLCYIENKIGIDINPLDVEDEEVRLWLKALIWREQVERLQILI